MMAKPVLLKTKTTNELNLNFNKDKPKLQKLTTTNLDAEERHP